MDYKVFDWVQAADQNPPQVLMVLRELCNDKIDIDEFVFQYSDARHRAGRSCPPSDAARTFKHLKEKFGFFTGNKII